MERQRTSTEPVYRRARKSYQTKDDKQRASTYWVVDYAEKGKRKKKQCKTEAEAKEFVEKFTEARARLGERFFDLSNAEIEDAIQALRIGKEHGRHPKPITDDPNESG